MFTKNTIHRTSWTFLQMHAKEEYDRTWPVYLRDNNNVTDIRADKRHRLF